MRKLPVCLGLGLLFALATVATAQSNLPLIEQPGVGARIDRVDITGNHRVEEEAIRVQIHSRAGGRLDDVVVDGDIRALYRMGFFENVVADFSEVAGKGVLTYAVVERPLIKELKIEGNKKINQEDMEAALKVRPNTILEPEKVRRGIEEAKKEYEKKGYLDASITWSTEVLPEHEVRLLYTVDEGTIVRITQITFEGARAFTRKKMLGVMQTSEEWFLSWFTNAGSLDRAVLKTDTDRLTAFYYENGYIDAKVDEPVVDRQADGLHVTIKIDEGSQYRVASVDFSGDLLPDMSAARAKLKVEPGEVFRTGQLREDITTVTDLYGDEGYAFVNVTPDTQVNPAEKLVQISYRVSKGPQVYIDKIDITGNIKTRDKVIRRELELDEQERFSGSKLRRSQERLRRLGFFEDVNITTRRAENEDRLDLLVDVKEASTGAFSAGAGLSSGENYLLNLRLSEINLFGRGQRLVFNIDFGELRQNFSLDFTEPYLMDTYVTAGTSLFSWRLFYPQFDREGTGGAIRLFYPVVRFGLKDIWGFPLDDVRLGMEYRLENSKISDVARSAATVIRAEQGSYLTSAITPRLMRDTRNHLFAPTRGSLQELSLQVAGLGGDSDYLKAEVRGRWFLPFYKSPTLGQFVFATGGVFGYGLGWGGDRELPLFERYFPGGINSVRGFEILKMGPQNLVVNQYGQLVDRSRIGGSQELILNNEIIFPIVEELGLNGVAFTDVGNAFTAAQGIDFGDLRVSVGPGIRWMSPVGPLRIELGFPLNRKVGDSEQTFMFSFGGGPM